MYHRGLGVKQDLYLAVDWYRLAALQGNANGQNNLGWMYANGLGVTRNYKEAVKWYRMAAEQGNANSQNHLGVMYANGLGVARDIARAYMWLEISEHSLDIDEKIKTLQLRNQLLNEMTAAQLDQAQAMEKMCAASNYHNCELDSVMSEVTTTPEISVPNRRRNATLSVLMKKQQGTYVVPVVINDSITLNFLVDSGASDVVIPADVVSTLKRTGTLGDSDFIRSQTATLADGTKIPSMAFLIRSLKVGDKVVEFVLGSTSPQAGDPLLGQSFLSRFKSWSIDNTTHMLVLTEQRQ